MKNNSTDWMVLAVSTITGVAAQLALKQAMLHSDPGPASQVISRGLIRLLSNRFLWIYGVAGVSSALTWWWVVKKFELGFAYPIVQSLMFILVLVVSSRMFSESIPAARWVGIALISTGLFLCK